MKQMCAFIVLLLCCADVSALDVVAPTADKAGTVIRYKGSRAYWMTERSDLRRYDNGKYTGLTSREVRSFVYPCEDTSSGVLFEGSFYVGEKTVSNFSETALSLDASIPARFYISSGGFLTPVIDEGFPTFRSFPAFPADPLEIGNSWTSQAVRAVDPLNKGVYTRVPMSVLYTFKGGEIYKGRQTYRIQASWATRYGISYRDTAGDADLIFASGSHVADIYVLPDTGTAFVIADKVDEEFRYTDGRRVQLKGTILLFTDFPPAVETTDLFCAFEKIARVKTERQNLNESNPGLLSDSFNFSDAKQSSVFADIKNDTVLEKTPAGLRLSLRNIRFLPDSTDFAPEELSRLDFIAGALQRAGEAKFLVEGHTAFVGFPDGEKRLSVQRALRLAEELTKRGISAHRFITRGLGAERPIASNETEQGRAQNRRVEITVLE